MKINYGRTPKIWKQRIKEMRGDSGADGYKSFRSISPTDSAMQFINVLNAIIADVQLVIRQQSDTQRKTETDPFVDIEDIQSMRDALKAVFGDADSDEQDAVRDMVDYLNDLQGMIDRGEPQEDQYTVLYYMTQQFRSAFPAYAKYVANTEAPDIVYDWDAELLPDGVSSNYSLRSLGALEYYKSKHNAEKRFVATKHSLSFGQVHDAYSRARELISGSGNGWVIIYPTSGLNKMQIEALIEEGLVTRNGNLMTLTRLGWEKPQWYKY